MPFANILPAALGAVGAICIATSAHADTREIYATQISTVNGWNYEQHALGTPGAGDAFACRESANSSNAPSGRAPGWLHATDFGAWTLPSGQRITRVYVDVYGSWTNSVAGSFDAEVRGLPSPLARTFTTTGTCHWLLGWEITASRPAGWAKADVDALSVRVRRHSATTPSEALWLEAFRIRVVCEPIPVGGCCLPGQRCSSLTNSDCAAADGEYFGDGVPCTATNCPAPGGCCLPGQVCASETESDCLGQGGRFFGNAPCTPIVCPVFGACCVGTLACQSLTSADCAAQGGQYFGDGAPCEPSSCAPTGACCLPGQPCVSLTSADCVDQGGRFQGGGTACTQIPCEPPPVEGGACCLPDGSCILLEVGECGLRPGTFQGDGTACESATCPVAPSGACCFMEGECAIAEEADCASRLGDYRGDGATCAPQTCAVTGACCLPGRAGAPVCQVLADSACESSGGAFVGPASVCAPTPCPSNDSCTNAIAISGTNTYPISNTNATTGPEGQNNAGCDDGDGSVPLDVWFRWTAPATGAFEVSTVGLTSGTDTKIVVYSTWSCGGPVIACNNDADEETYESRAIFNAARGARYLIQIGTITDYASPGDRFAIRRIPSSRGRSCTADFNGDGTADPQDLFDFLGAYLSNDLAADVNGSGGLSAQDIYDYLSSYFAGCP